MIKLVASAAQVLGSVNTVCGHGRLDIVILPIPATGAIRPFQQKYELVLYAQNLGAVSATRERTARLTLDDAVE